MLQLNQAHDDEEIDSSLSSIFFSNGANPKDMTTRSSAPHHHVFSCSSVGGPHGHNNDKLNSSLSCSFVLVLQVSHTHNDEELDSSSSCNFFVQVLEVPMGMMTRSCRSIKRTTTRSSTFHYCVFIVPLL